MVRDLMNTLLELIVSLLTKRFQEFNLSVKGGVHIKQMTVSKGESKSNLGENCQILSQVELYSSIIVFWSDML